MNEIYLQEGLQIIKEHPLRYLALSTYRFTMLWFNWRVNEVYGKRDTVGDYIMVFQHIFFLTGGVIGLRGRFQRAWPLVISIVSFSALYMAVMAHLPYIISIVPGLVALSAIALAQLVPVFARNLSQRMRRIHEH